MHYIGVTDGKRKKGRQNKFQHIFFHTIYFFRCIQNLENLALIGAEKSVMKNFIGEKENCTNKALQAIQIQWHKITWCG